MKNDNILDILNSNEKKIKKKLGEKIYENIKNSIGKISHYSSNVMNKFTHKNADILLIYNPVSGQRTADISAEDLIQFFKRENISYKAVKTKPNSELIPNIKPKMIIIIGGDGTIHLTINEMVKKNLIKVPIAVLGTGVGNDFPNANKMSKFKIKKYLKKYKEALKKGELPTYNYDLGRIETDTGKVIYFVNSISVNSLDADVIRNIYQIWKKKANSEGDYILPLFKSFFVTYRPKKYKLEYFKPSKNKKKRVRTVKFKKGKGGVLIYNNYRRAEGNLNLPDAKTDDGLLNIVYYRKINFINAMLYAIIFVRHFFLRKLAYDLSFYEYFNVKSKNSFIVSDEFAIARIAPVYIMECDGELYENNFKEIIVSVVPKALNIIDVSKI